MVARQQVSRLRVAIRRCHRGDGASVGLGRVCGGLTVKPSLRNSLAHRDRRRSVLNVLAGASLSDSKAVWRSEWSCSRCSCGEGGEDRVLASPMQAASPRTSHW